LEASRRRALGEEAEAEGNEETIRAVMPSNREGKPKM